MLAPLNKGLKTFVLGIVITFFTTIDQPTCSTKVIDGRTNIDNIDGSSLRWGIIYKQQQF